MTRKLLIGALFFAHTAWAGPQEEMLYYRDGVRIDPVEVSRVLAGPMLKRSIRMLPEPTRGDAPLAVGAGAVTVSPVAASSVELVPARERAESIALPVQFAFDSADILPRARTQLDAVAQGIKLLPESTSVLIEGHTDALGTHQYNLQLSRRRAEAVKRYLVSEHGLNAQRLKTIGFGEDRPIDGADASKPENRRVQFRGA